MRRTAFVTAGFAALLATAALSPAFAGYGALAHDEASGKYGISSNEESQRKAEDVAKKQCGSDKCTIVFRTASGQCGAIALAESGNAWGADKGRPRSSAELGAIKNCQKRTKGQCKVRAAECNR